MKQHFIKKEGEFFVGYNKEGEEICRSKVRAKVKETLVELERFNCNYPGMQIKRKYGYGAPL